MQDVLSGEKSLECDGAVSGAWSALAVGSQGNTGSRIEAELRGEGCPLSTTASLVDTEQRSIEVRNAFHTLSCFWHGHMWTLCLLDVA